MICYLYDKESVESLGAVDLVPECGADFCDNCGDCLVCYSHDPCFYDDGQHRWVKHVDANWFAEWIGGAGA